jgi:hypothetical protein
MFRAQYGVISGRQQRFLLTIDPDALVRPIIWPSGRPFPAAPGQLKESDRPPLGS